MRFALVAQLVEHTLGKGEVSGSNPLKSSITRADMKVSAFVLGGHLVRCPGFWLAPPLIGDGRSECELSACSD